MTGAAVARRRGAVAHRAGLSAEESVVRRYAEAGATPVARRWRGTAGEIDLVLREGAVLVFVEVKASRTFARAAERVGPAQSRRLLAAAAEYLAGTPEGQLSETRFDVALVDPRGAVRVIGNALGA